MLVRFDYVSAIKLIGLVYVNIIIIWYILCAQILCYTKEIKKINKTFLLTQIEKKVCTHTHFIMILTSFIKIWTLNA